MSMSIPGGGNSFWSFTVFTCCQTAPAIATATRASNTRRVHLHTLYLFTQGPEERAEKGPSPNCHSTVAGSRLRAWLLARQDGTARARSLAAPERRPLLR